MYKIFVEYDGTNLLGWQKQPEGDSVQGFLEAAIYNFCQEKVDVYGAGRTDAGVHAIEMTAHFAINKDILEYNLVEGLNYHLRKLNASVVVLRAEKVDDDFHARFSAKSRSYVYKIINRRAPLALARQRAWHVSYPLDIKAMQEACQYFVGQHDFSSFRAAACQAKSPIKTIDVFEITKNGDDIEIYIKAQSFLHNQVRNMVGAIKEVGAGRYKPCDIKTFLDKRNRKEAPVCAPACGLYFLCAEY